MERENGIVGEWRNELGSVLAISSASGGEIRGTYRTTVARADLLPVPAEVLGSYQKCDDGGVLVTFCVQWTVTKDGRDSRSACCWNGKLQPGSDTFEMTYLLVSDLPSEDMWRGVLTNKNIFKRVS